MATSYDVIDEKEVSSSSRLGENELLEQLKEEVKDAKQAAEHEHKYAKMMARTIYESTMSERDRNNIQSLNKPDVEANMLAPQIFRLTGEFVYNEPSFLVNDQEGKFNPQMVDLVDMHLRALMDKTHAERGEIYQEAMVKGSSVVKYWTEYANYKSIMQVIRWGRTYDSSLTYFDQLARGRSKEDAQLGGELFPKTYEQVLNMGYKVTERDFKLNDPSNSDFTWGYSGSGKQKVALLCSHYKIEWVRKKLIYAADGETYFTNEYNEMVKKMERESAAVPPAIVKTRMTEVPRVIRYLFLPHKILETKETKYPGVPLIRFDGNSHWVSSSNDGDQMKLLSRSYVHDAVDLQRLLNLSMVQLGDEIVNMPALKLTASEESLPEKAEWKDAYINPQKRIATIYKEWSDDGQRQNSAPFWTPRPPIPPEIAQTFFGLPAMIQNVLGAHGSELGNPDNSLSGRAIEIGATNSGVTASPYVNNFLHGWNVLLQAIVDLLPIYYTTPRTIPLMDKQGSRGNVKINQNNKQDIQYKPGQLKVNVSPGVNLEVQNSRTLTALQMGAQVNPGLQQLISGPGLPLLIETMNIRNKDEWKELAIKLTQQQQQAASQPPPPNPELQLKQAELTIKSQQGQAKDHLEEMKINEQQRQARVKEKLEAAKIRSANVKNAMDFAVAKQQAKVDLDKAATERAVHHVELGMKQADLEHSHLTDMIGLHNDLNQQEQDNERQDANEEI